MLVPLREEEGRDNSSVITVMQPTLEKKMPIQVTDYSTRTAVASAVEKPCQASEGHAI
jgi:hypothetical protein